MKNWRKIALVSILLFSLLFAMGTASAQNRPLVVGNNGMVAAICPMAAIAGLEILQAGGNAFDAYAAVSAVQTITNPANVSPGGGGAAIMYINDEDRMAAVDYMGRIPYAATPEIFQGRDEPWRGYTAGLVPGNIGGWYDVHQKYGKLPLEQVWARAIYYGENGFPASADHAFSLEWEFAMIEYPTSRAVYYPENRVPKIGDITYNKDLANTYRMIIEHGIEWLYEGEGADMIVDHMEKYGGLITHQDLKDFTVDWYDPIYVDYKGYKFFSLPPQSANVGIIQLMALQIIKGFDLKDMGHMSADYIHHITEAFKVADATFYQQVIPEERSGVPLTDDFIEWLLSEEFAAQQRELIDSSRATAVSGKERYLIDSPQEVAMDLELGDEGGTSTLSIMIADQYGNVVSAIQSAGLWYGSRVVIEGLGFVTTSMIQFADRNPDYIWSIQGGTKVPIAMAPTFVKKDDQPFAIMGTGGTETIFQCSAQIVLNMVEFGMDPRAAILAPRFAARGTWADPPGQPGKFELHRSNQLRVELMGDVTYETAINLANRGHYMLYQSHYGGYGLGGYSMVVFDHETGTFYGAGDPRLRSYAVGY